MDHLFNLHIITMVWLDAMIYFTEFEALIKTGQVLFHLQNNFMKHDIKYLFILPMRYSIVGKNFDL